MAGTSPRAIPGPAYLVVSTVLLALVGAIAKIAGERYPIGEVLLARHLVPVILAVVVFGPAMGTGLVRTGSLRLQLLRSLAFLGSTGFYFLALQFMPLAETAAIAFIAPIITVVLSVPLLGERVSGRVVVAAVVGFAGVVAVVQPGTGQAGLAALLPIGCAISSSLFAILTRKLGGRDPAATTWFYTSVVSLVAASLMAPIGWTAPASGADLVLLALLGLLGGVAHFLTVKAYQRTAASALAPLTYLELAWLTLLGLLAFDEVPDLLSLAGIGLIAVSGVVVAFRPRGAEVGADDAPDSPPPG